MAMPIYTRRTFIQFYRDEREKIESEAPPQPSKRGNGKVTRKISGNAVKKYGKN
jgi:hypothetical protein